jgi:hypothetical protein
VRLSALWDQPHIDNETILTVIELVDNEVVIEALAAETRSQWEKMPEPLGPNESPEEKEIVARLLKAKHAEFGEEQAQCARGGLKKAIADARAMRKSPQLASIRNLRNKHVAHYLTQTNAEKSGEIIAPMKVGDERVLLESSIAIIQALYCWVNGTSISFEESQKIDRKCAQELWNACKFDIPRRGA